MASSTAVSGSFERRSGVAHQQHSSITSVHLAGRQSLSSSYTMPTTAQPTAPFEGIVDFSYHQAHFAGYNPSPSDSSLQHHQASPASRVDSSEWKQSSFFSYRPNEVKHRKRTTRQQLKVLEETFRSTQKPDGNVRKSLALQLNMTPRNVQVWFQNRRAKDKTLAKRALRSVEEVRAHESGQPASSADDNSEAVASPRSEQDVLAQYGASMETHSGSASPIESVFPTAYEVPTPVYVTNDLVGVVSPSSSSYSHQSDLGQVQSSAYQSPSSFGSDTSAGTQFPAIYATRDVYAPRASLPHIHATAFQQDSQHQRSNSSPTFPCNVDATSNLSLTTYASIHGVLYPQQQRFQNAAPQRMYAQRNPVGPLPAADFSFGMNADAEADTELTGYASYSQFGSVSGSDTPSSVGGLSHYGSVASLAESARSFDEDGAPFNWKTEQRRGSIPLGIRPAFTGLVGGAFSPLSVGYSSNSPCPGAESAEQESDGAENAIYMTSRSLKMEGIDSNQAVGYPQGAFGFNGGVDQDTSHTEAYQRYLNYGQQQTVSDNMLYSYAPIQPEIQMPQPTAYGVYRFA